MWNCAGTGYESVDVARNLEIRRFFQKEWFPCKSHSLHFLTAGCWEWVLQGEIRCLQCKTDQVFFPPKECWGQWSHPSRIWSRIASGISSDCIPRTGALMARKKSRRAAILDSAMRRHCLAERCSKYTVHSHRLSEGCYLGSCKYPWWEATGERSVVMRGQLSWRSQRGTYKRPINTMFKAEESQHHTSAIQVQSFPTRTTVSLLTELTNGQDGVRG